MSLSFVCDGIQDNSLELGKSFEWQKNLLDTKCQEWEGDTRRLALSVADQDGEPLLGEYSHLVTFPLWLGINICHQCSCTQVCSTHLE